MGYVEEGKIIRIMPGKRQWVMEVESKKIADFKKGIEVNNYGLNDDCRGYKCMFENKGGKGDMLVFVQLDKLADTKYVDAIKKMDLSSGKIYAVDVVNSYQIYTVNKSDLIVNRESKCSLDEICKEHFQVPGSSMSRSSMSAESSLSVSTSGVSQAV